jgi:hypothetical protein
MTLAELESMECNTLTVKQVAEFLGKDPQVIRDQAEREPKYLGFPICKAGHSYCIPRIGFIAWVKGNTPVMLISTRIGTIAQPDSLPKILYDT